MTVQQIKVVKTTNPKEKTPAEELVFGRVFTDHMFTLDYTEGKGWHDPQIIPYQPLTLDPAAVIFHYGQTVFEGMKAYLSDNGKIRLFRPDLNFKRLNASSERISMPQLDESEALEYLKQLLEVEKSWIPTAPGTSLYIRPFIISTEAYLGVAPATTYKFMIILCPVGSYYKEGIKPVRIAVESRYVRAVLGGTGTAKTAGNYAAGLKAQEVAEAKGYSQVLWLDGVERKYIEEVGAMNVFFKINGEVVTPELNGSILDGVTRRSIIELLQHWNVPVTERRVSIDEIVEASKNGTLEEAYGTGTAAVISPVGELYYNDEKVVINNGETGELSKKLYDALTGIQNGVVEDVLGWTVEI